MKIIHKYFTQRCLTFHGIIADYAERTLRGMRAFVERQVFTQQGSLSRSHGILLCVESRSLPRPCYVIEGRTKGETLQRLNDNLIDVIRTKETLHRSGDKFSNNKDRAKPVKNITRVIHIHRTIYKNHMGISGNRISLIDSTSHFVKNIVSPYVFPTGQRYRINESLNITQYG